MNSTLLTGLGKPAPFGKKSLFQPPSVPEQKQSLPAYQDSNKKPAKKPSKTLVKAHGTDRLAMTLEITKKSLLFIQEYQNRYRLERGYVIPKWQIISEALELFEKSKAGEGNENTK